MNNNGADLVDPDIGNAGKYGTANSGCWALGDGFDFIGRQPFSFSMWTRAFDNEAPFYPRLFANFEYSNGRTGYSFEHIEIEDGGGVVFVRAVGGINSGVSSSVLLPTTDFSQLVGTYDGTTMRLYRDGQLVDQENSTAEIPIAPGNFSLGCEGGNPFEGIIDEFRVSDQARSADWVQAQYQLTSNPAAVLDIGPPTLGLSSSNYATPT